MRKVISYFKTLPSIMVIVFICLTIIEVHLNLIRYEKREVIAWDVGGYYGYLPALIIKKDLKLNFINEHNKWHGDNGNYVYTISNDSSKVLKYPLGMAVLYSPFFIIAHVLATPLGYVNNGFSEIYHFFIEFSGLFYILLGFIYLRKTLRMYYTENITALTIIFIYYGTNLLFYTTIDSAMSHAYTFSLFSIFNYGCIHFLNKPNIKYTLLIGITYGLMVLVRPINLLFALPLMLIGIISINDFKNRLLFFLKHFKLVFLFVLIALIVFLPQLFYWNYVSNHWFFFSYGKEKFYFNNPHIYEVLFGFRKGWFIYTPLALFALSGFYFLRKQTANVFLITNLILFPIYIFIISCWWCWWYGGSHSQRSLIDLYPLMAFGFAAIFYRVHVLPKTKKNIAYISLGILLLLSLFQTYQYKHNIIHYDSMTFKRYKNIFFKIRGDPGDTLNLQKPNYEKAVLGLDE